MSKNQTRTIEQLKTVQNAFNCLDRETGRNGFWSPEQKTYARLLIGVKGDEGWEKPDHRYTLFGLAGALRAHRKTCAGNLEHLKQASEWTYDAVQTGIPQDSFYYGGLWALAEAALVFKDEKYGALAVQTIRNTRNAFVVSPDLNYCVGMFGISQLLKTRTCDTYLFKVLKEKCDQITYSINDAGIPATGDYRAGYHQRLMYTCWGLLGSAWILHNEKAIMAAEKILDFVTDKRIDKDGGIRWHSVVEQNVLPRGLPGIYPYGYNLYYECHQCFYLIAVHLFHKLTNTKNYFETSKKVHDWIFGKNRWQMDLTGLGIMGLPIRCISSKGRYSLPLNRFKGCYEVGSFLWAMTEIYEGQL